MRKTNIAILGATGMVGQRFITLLENHPYFDVKVLAASINSKGKRYEDAVYNKWKINTPIPHYVKDIIVEDVNDVELISDKVELVLCALDMPKEEIIELEEKYAKSEVVVISNNSANRWTKDVPMIIPEINKHHLEIIKEQKKRLGTNKGFIVVKPNCSIQSYVPLLDAVKKFGIEEVFVSTYQAISGSGKNFIEWPQMIENIIPYISGEEEKSEKEPLRIWGNIKNNEIIPNDEIKITAQCIRVPVLDGHLATVWVKFKNKPTKEEILNCWENYESEISVLDLPLSPKKFINYFSDDDRPQPILDINIENGMGISVGRLREDNIFDFKFVGLSHNTIRGAAGGALLTAELVKKLELV